MKLSKDEIEVNDRMIEEFMLTSEGTDICLFDNTIDYFFHKSWDWLIPVVEKIESLVDEKGCAIYNVVIQQCFVEIIENHTSDEIVNLDRDNKKDAIYDAVVEFIKYYNENN